MAQNQAPNEEKKPLTAVTLFRKDSVQEQFDKLLGKKAPAFITNVLQAVQNSDMLQTAEPLSILNAALKAAALDLIVDPNFGQAWIIPYKDGKTGKTLAQFQMGWKGYVQLAHRSNQYEKMNAIAIHDNQFISWNPLTEDLEVNMSVVGSGTIAGYAAYFKLKNGFYKVAYWSAEEVQKHAKKYSKSFGKGGGIGWNDKDNYDNMCLKTVLKNTINKWGIMSIEMQTAHLADQAVIEEDGKYRYVDNEQVDQAEIARLEENSRALRFIAKAETMDDLEMIISGFPDMEPETREILDEKEKQLKKQLKS